MNADFGALVTSELSAERRASVRHGDGPGPGRDGDGPGRLPRLLGNPHYAQQLFHAWQDGLREPRAR